MKYLTALTFVFGLLLAMYDGSLFPYINLLGLVVFCASVPMSWRIRE